MEHAHLYKGLSIRATQFRNGQVLAEQGVKVCFLSHLNLTCANLRVKDHPLLLFNVFA
jgi:hypothetical protein